LANLSNVVIGPGLISGAAEPVVTEVERSPTTRTTKVKENFVNMTRL